MKTFIAPLLIALLALFAACSAVDDTGLPNQPPTVWLSAAPPEGSTSKYRVQLFWGGWDPDGEIGHYEYLISDNLTGIFNPADTVGVPWAPVVGNDSTFTFSADSLIGGTPDPAKPLVKYFARSHTFFIRAVDREGLRSRSAYRSFTSRTLSPEVIIDAPKTYFLNPSVVPAISTFKWRAKDYVDDVLISQDPDSVQWIMTRQRVSYTATLDSIRAGKWANEWYPWVWYRAPGDSGKFWTTPVMDVGAYVFAIRAKDEAGAVTPVFDLAKNVRFVRVASKTNGPLMTASNPYLGVIRSVSCTTPMVILDMPAGVPIQFKITADASQYGGTETGYRYGWDISDLTDPEQWEIDYTPFPGTCPQTGKPDIPCVALPARTFFFGVHTISMEVIDNSGYCTRIEVKVNVVPFTLERSLLIVDDDNSDEGAGWATTNGTNPSDAEHDAFWLDMASGVAGFDPAIDVVEITTATQSTGVPLTTIARYKSIIFTTYGDFARKGSFPLLYNYIQFRSKDPSKATTVSGKVLPNVLALAMAAGSHVMIAGREPIQYVINRTYAGGAKYPLIFQYELEGKQSRNSPPDFNNPVGDLSFAYKDLCLETIEFAPLVTAFLRTNTGSNPNYCDVSPRFGTRNDQSFGLRTARPLDPNFPALNLRPEAADPGKTYAPGSQSLTAEIYNASYFRKPFCDYVPSEPRSCFEKIYGLGSENTSAKTYDEPIAFWTSVYADVVAEVPGAVGARSIVLGFPPVFFNPSEVKPAIEHVLYDEWQLPRDTNALEAAAQPN